MRYYIADPHFFHAALNTKMDKRGFESVEQMNQYMLDRWNEKVRKNDEVVIIGDLSWGKAEETNELLDRLNGRLYLIQGNHDRFLKNKDYNANRFVWVKPYEELQDNKRKVILCHYPVMCYNGQYRVDEEGNPKVYMLYGHVHDTQDQRLLEQFQEVTRSTTTVSPDGISRQIPCHMINCFCMYSDYTPQLWMIGFYVTRKGEPGMCGRYYVDDETAREIEKVVREVDAKLRKERMGDIYPSQTAAVLTGKIPGLKAEEMNWGFPQYQKRGLLINARAETVLERKTFRESVLHRRCIIPAKHFYEWDSGKNKVTFLREDEPVLYMAGFYNRFQEEERFIIITTQANESVKKIHDRMPLILERQELEDWIYDDNFLEFALHKVPVQLIKHQEYEQQSLF